LCYSISNFGVLSSYVQKERKITRYARKVPKGGVAHLPKVGVLTTQRFIEWETAERFQGIDDWDFIAKRRVEVRDGEFQEFTGMIALLP
jgi:uncharacterized protein YfaQ (DUF2300 family)